MLRTTIRRPSLYRPLTTTACRRNTTRTQHSNDSAEKSTAHNTPVNSSEPKPLNPTQSSETYVPSSSYDLVYLRERARQWSEETASAWRRRTDDFTAATRTTFSQLGSQLNKVTGYEEIEALKKKVVEQEARINATREAAREAKAAYDAAVIQRSNSQREVNDLLQRKSNWIDSDVSRFTTLVRQDHLYEQNEAHAKAAVAQSEDEVEKEFSELMRSILARYHEEQVWSDKIRSASTYGSLAVLGLNLVVFLLAIVVVEPWKRRRLAQTFEKKIEEMSMENAAMVENGMKGLGRHFEEQGKLLSVMVEGASKNAVDISPSTSSLMGTSTEPPLPSERHTRAARDRELAAAAASSAMVAGVFGWLARRWSER